MYKLAVIVPLYTQHNISLFTEKMQKQCESLENLDTELNIIVIFDSKNKDYEKEYSEIFQKSNLFTLIKSNTDLPINAGLDFILNNMPDCDYIAITECCNDNLPMLLPQMIKKFQYNKHYDVIIASRFSNEENSDTAFGYHARLEKRKAKNLGLTKISDLSSGFIICKKNAILNVKDNFKKFTLTEKNNIYMTELICLLAYSGALITEIPVEYYKNNTLVKNKDIHALAKELKKIEKYRFISTKLLNVLITILILMTDLFLISELTSYQNDFFNTISSLQEEKLLQYKNSIDIIYESSPTLYDIENYLRNYSDTSSENWYYILYNDNLVYYKDTNLLPDLNPDNSVSLTSDKEIIVSEIKYNENYTIGAISLKQPLLIKRSITKHNTYIFISYAFFSIVFYAVLIYFSHYLSQLKTDNISKSQQILNANKKIFNISSSKLSTKTEVDIISKKDNIEIYNQNIIYPLLKKSSDKKLYPLSIMFISIVMSNRYYTKAEIFNVINTVRKYLLESHVLVEIKKGEFVIFMYKTSHSKSQEIKNNLKNEWSNMPSLKKETIKTLLLTVDENVKNNLNEVFDNMLLKLRNEDFNRKSNNHNFQSENQTSFSKENEI